MIPHANKFFAPQLDPDLHLARRRLLDRGKPHSTAERILLVEAQAGQGKSVFVAQYLAERNRPCYWYQVGTEDCDPIALIENLYAWLAANCPGFIAPELQSIITHGELLPEQTGYYSELLVCGLQETKQTMTLVFDDLYFVENAAASNQVIGQLTTTAPDNIQFVLISRRSITTQLALGASSAKKQLVDNHDLAFNHREVADYFLKIEGRPLADTAIDTLQQTTEGWIMGLLLARNAVDGAHFKALTQQTADGLFDYFLLNVFSELPPALQHTLYRLALLETIPLQLARELAVVDNIETEIDQLARRNFFLIRLGEKADVFRFHRLFSAALRSTAESRLGEAELCEVRTTAGHWHLKQNDPEAALRYFLAAKDYAPAQEVLKNLGMTLHAHNRIVSLQSALSSVPEESLASYPWLAYFRGIVAVNTEPLTALPWFELARRGFCTRDDAHGELASLIQIIHYHMTVDSRYNLGRAPLERAADLFSSLADQLTAAQTINTANMLLLGYALFNNDSEKAGQFYNTGLKLVSALDQKNLEAETHLARFYRNIFLGDHRGCNREIEQSLTLLGSPRVSAINKAMLLLGQLNLLVNEADYVAYENHKDLCRKLLGKELFDKSILGAYVSLWDMDMHFAQGKTDLASDEIQKALGGDFAYASAHLRSQYLQYHAFLLACDKRDEQALAAAEESLTLRAEVGCPFFELFNAALIGATFAQLGRYEKAEEFFSRGLADSDIHGAFYAKPTLLAQRTYWRLLSRSGDCSQDDLKALLCDLKKNGFRQLWLCTPQLMLRLLAEAVRGGIETDYARSLAAERYRTAILDDGTLIPLLCINTLGQFEIRINDDVVLSTVDLTDTQRQLLAMLVVAPNQALPLEEAQLTLWPERSALKARTSIDTLVSRLRKTVDSALGDIPVRHYLQLKRGVIMLTNCRIDLVTFRENSRKGLNHLRRHQFWQAGNTLQPAFELWQGDFMPGVPLGETGEQTRNDLKLLGAEVALQLTHLNSAHQPEEARRIASRALHHDPTNESLVRCLYNLHATANDTINATRVMDRYVKALRQHGFDAADVEEILNSFWKKPSR